MEFGITKAVEILTDKLQGWLESLTAMLPNFVVAIVVLVLFFFLARGVRLLSDRVFKKFYDNPAIRNLFSTTVYITVIAIGLMVALNVLHLKQTVTSLLAGAGIIGLALGFAFQDISANFISGVLIAIRKPIQPGDIIKVDDFMGTVEEINLRVTIIKTFQGLHVIIPNRKIFQNALTNYTKTNERRIDLECGVSYGDDLEKAKELAVEAVESQSFIMDNSEVKLFYTGFGDSSINYVLQFWIKYPDQPGFLEARSQAIMAVKKAYDENDITIPFPIRTLDFGIKGGETLSDMNMQVSSKNGYKKESVNQ
ncbi:Mechanosensitive ion channel [Ekhidna lutea]|uniref:Mechanosensitive ion channel n=1 Tax=Ekhidna lutea TaxID=447679 RepID=A0A239HT87_EKHLU|nr:mechanosensitive ion channel domain-containing protein [Ekhidna lutea]SNS84570.1 Mechanosensitive ion channel [Ekhidna lutea]